MTAAETTAMLKSRAAAATAAMVIAALAMSLLALPVGAAFQAQDHRFRASLQVLAVSKAEGSVAPALRQQVLELRQRLGVLPGALEAKTAPLGQAQLQQTLETIMGSHGADVRSVQMLPAASRSGFEVLSIQYDLSVPMSKFADLVYAIETHVPYLFIADASISGNASQAAEQDPALEVRWTIKAYRWSGAR